MEATNIFKKTLLTLVFIFLFCTHFVFAEEYHRKGYSDDLYRVTNDVPQEQHFKNFMLDLLIPEILNTARKQYHDKSISGMSFDWENHYNVVEIIESQLQDTRQEYPYMVIVIVSPHSGGIKNRKSYGTDKITFGIDPNIFWRNVKDRPAIKLINYQHLKSSKSP